MWTMDLEVRPEHAEIFHYLVVDRWTPGSVQFFKSKYSVVLINTESTCRHRQNQETNPTPGFFDQRPKPRRGGTVS